MNIKHLNIGIQHSLIGKNDGVSIVIDQTVNAMVNNMGINLGNIFFLAAHTSPRFNAETNEIFWHKNEVHKTILKNFSSAPPKNLDAYIHKEALYAKEVISEFISRNKIDLFIAHNISHPYNFITAVGLGYYIEEQRAKGVIWPKVLVWWHDSYFERALFKNPNAVIKKYLKYLPGTYVDGIAFINKLQVELARRQFRENNPDLLHSFMENRTTVVPNTSDIPWDWQNQDWDSDAPVFPKQDNYNNSFLKDTGVIARLNKLGYKPDDAVYLLQHTRVVPRKKIELAIDLAFLLEKRFLRDGLKKCVVILVSGHSGDEQFSYKKYLTEYFEKKLEENKDAGVIIDFGEDRILSHRDIIVDRKFYKFAEIPSLIAAKRGIGTYFSEVEGFGNNLLEMVSLGLPVVINKYEVYKNEIEHLGFNFPAIEDGQLNDKIVEEAYRLLTDMKYRNQMVLHNLKVLHEKLDHKIIEEKLRPLIKKMFTEVLT